MLKIRIAGTEGELRQIAHKAGSTRIKRFKRDNGKTTFAIDVEISVKDFLNNLDLSNAEGSQLNNAEGSEKNTAEKCNSKEIQRELEALLEEISDK